MIKFDTNKPLGWLNQIEATKVICLLLNHLNLELWGDRETGQFRIEPGGVKAEDFTGPR